MMYNDDSSNVQTHAVKTKIVTVQHTVTEFWLENMSIDKKQIFEDVMKEKLANEMARTLLKENLVLFTKESHPDKFDTIYRARCYLADKQDVALIANIK
jgi:hypothetical protein